MNKDDIINALKRDVRFLLREADRQAFAKYFDETIDDHATQLYEAGAAAERESWINKFNEFADKLLIIGESQKTSVKDILALLTQTTSKEKYDGIEFHKGCVDCLKRRDATTSKEASDCKPCGNCQRCHYINPPTNSKELTNT